MANDRESRQVQTDAVAGEKPRRPEVAAGMAAARAQGVRLGRPSRTALPPSAARVKELRGQGLSLQKIADALQQENVPTLTGDGTWNKSTVQYLLRRLAAGDPIGE